MTLHTVDQPHADGIDRLTGKRRLQQLLIRRDRLALAAAVFEAHDLGDPAEIRDIQFNIEAQLQTEYEATYDRLLPAWVQRDAALAHSWETPIAACPICQRRPGADLANTRRSAA